MLWIALVGRDSGQRCSKLIGIHGETAALDLDLSCSIRLLEFDNKREHTRMKYFKQMMKEAIAEVILGVKPPANESDPDIDQDIPEDDYV